MHRLTLVFWLLIVFGGGRAVVAQGHEMQGHGQHQAAMPEKAQDMAAADRIMQNIGKMMARVSTTMQDLNMVHGGMSNGEQHHVVMTALQGTFDQMQQLRGSLREMMNDPALAMNKDAMRSFEQTCKNLEQMTAGLESMAKNMTKAMKGMGGASS